MPELENVAPKIYTKSKTREITEDEKNANLVDEIDAREIFDLIRDINDPEHPLTLEELNVVEEDKCFVSFDRFFARQTRTPTLFFLFYRSTTMKT